MERLYITHYNSISQCNVVKLLTLAIGTLYPYSGNGYPQLLDYFHCLVRDAPAAGLSSLFRVCLNRYLKHDVPLTPRCRISSTAVLYLGDGPPSCHGHPRSRFS